MWSGHTASRSKRGRSTHILQVVHRDNRESRRQEAKKSCWGPLKWISSSFWLQVLKLCGKKRKTILGWTTFLSIVFIHYELLLGFILKVLRGCDTRCATFSFRLVWWLLLSHITFFHENIDILRKMLKSSSVKKTSIRPFWEKNFLALCLFLY